VILVTFSGSSRRRRTGNGKLKEVAVGILDQYILLAPGASGGAIYLEAKALQVRRRGCEIGHFQLEVERTPLIDEQPQSSLTQTEHGEATGQVKQNRSARQPAIELKGAIDVRDVQGEPDREVVIRGDAPLRRR
jgi:hypothetical protein